MYHNYIELCLYMYVLAIVRLLEAVGNHLGIQSVNGLQRAPSTSVAYHVTDCMFPTPVISVGDLSLLVRWSDVVTEVLGRISRAVVVPGGSAMA